MREKRVEERLCEEVKKVGGKAYKLSAAVDTGMPDRLVCLPGGRVVFVETKRPKDGRLSPLQKYRHRELNGLGFDVYVISTIEQVREFIAKKAGAKNEV